MQYPGGMGRAADDPWAQLPLRERMPEYIALFGVGIVAAAVIGWLVGLIFSVPISQAIGSACFALGLFCLLGGGAAGGEYKALGLGQGIGRVKHIVDEDPNVLQDLRSARRPGRNPAAFWMVIAGALYTAAGLLLVSLD